MPQPAPATRFLRLCGLAATLSLSPALFAQQPAANATAPSPNLAGIAHVALRVHDLAASLAFYEKLGFVKAFDLSRNGAVYEAFIKINDRQFIELYPADAKNTQIGFLHLCFEGNDLNAAHDYYVAQGLTPNAVRTAGAGNLLFTMPGPMTPQGPQNLEYTQYMPGSLHSKDIGQHLGKDRIATSLVDVVIAAVDPDDAKAFYQNKAGFVSSHAFSPDSWLLQVPGNPAQSITLARAQGIGFHAVLSFRGGAPFKADKDHLVYRGLSFSLGSSRERTFTDPDGNRIIVKGV